MNLIEKSKRIMICAACDLFNVYNYLNFYYLVIQQCETKQNKMNIPVEGSIRNEIATRWQKGYSNCQICPPSIVPQIEAARKSRGDARRAS